MGLKLGLLNWEMTCFWFFAWSYSSTKAWNYLENCCFLLLGMLFWEFLKSDYIIICFKFFIQRTPTIFKNWSVINFCFKVTSVFNSWSNESPLTISFVGSMSHLFVLLKMFTYSSWAPILYSAKHGS